MATGERHTKFVKIGPTVSEICSQTDRQTDHNTPLPYHGRVTRQTERIVNKTKHYRVILRQNAILCHRVSYML